MGCCTSARQLDRYRIHSAIVLQSKGATSRYHGTTARHRCQTLGDAELILAEDGIYSQVIDGGCCADDGFIYIPLMAIRNIEDHAWFNGLYRLDRPHLVVSYVIPGKGEYQAGWQMTSALYEQWRTAIERLIEQANRD